MASLLLAQSRRPLISPALTAAASCPVALCYWFVNPWAIPLGAFSMVLLGHAMSRERRIHIAGLRKFGRESEDESTTRLWIFGPISKRLVASVALIAIAVVAFVARSYAWATYDSS